MQPNSHTLLCRYHYDPLDRLAASTPAAQADAQRFYQKDRLATEIQGTVQHSIMQHDDQLLAQQQRQGGTVETTLLATDQQRSVVNAPDTTQPHPLAYTPYGHRAPEGGLLSLLGFNGERPDPVTGHYVLGNGYRAFNPVLMRFNSPDSWSPFGKGGLNAYAYCVGDPVNRQDPTGHMPFNLVNRIGNSSRRPPSTIRPVGPSVGSSGGPRENPARSSALDKEIKMIDKEMRMITREHDELTQSINSRTETYNKTQKLINKNVKLSSHVVSAHKALRNELSADAARHNDLTFQASDLGKMYDHLVVPSYDEIANDLLPPPSYTEVVDNIRNT